MKRASQSDDQPAVVPVRAGGLTGFVARALAADGAAEPERLRARQGAAVLKESRSTLVFVAPVGGQLVVVKRYRKERLAARLLMALRRSRARRAWTCAYALRAAAIRVPRALGALEARRLRVLRRSYALAEFVAAAETLKRVLRSEPPGSARRLGIARRLGRLLGRIHAAGFRARDLKAANFLVDGAGRVWLVDLDGVRPARARRIRARRGRDLARLLRDVAGSGRLDPGERRAFVRGYRRGQRRARSRRVPPAGPASGATPGA